MGTPALQRALAATDDATRLNELLVAWRSLRHPRIAELIDRVSAKLAKPLTAKSVVARTEAIIKAAQSNDAVQLGHALVSAWPGSWQAAIPVLEAVAKAPDDPRVAKKFAEIIDAMPHTSNGSTAYWAVIFGRLNSLIDVRQTALLEAQLTRSKSGFYEHHSRSREDTVARLHRLTTIAELASDDDALVTQLEAPFAALAATEKGADQSGADLLAAVWAHPTDLGVRAVYGDWLVGQGDPRGEFIALQLAPRTEKSERKIEKLRDAHWKKWLGPIGDWFREPPVFEAGFPISGDVEDASHARNLGSRLEHVLTHPEWSTFRSVTLPWGVFSPAKLVAHPRFKALDHLRHLYPEYVEAVAKLKPALKALSFDWGGDGNLRLAKGTWDQFPKLERIFTRGRFIDVVLSGLGRQRLRTLEIDCWGPDSSETLDAWWPQFDAAPIDEVVLVERSPLARITRARADAPFTRAHFFSAGHSMAHRLPPGTTHLTCDLPPAEVARGWELLRFTQAMQRYTKLEVQQPLAIETPHRVELRIPGLDALAADTLEKVWKLVVDDLGATFNQLSTNDGKYQSFSGTLADLQKAARPKRVEHVLLVLTATRVALSLRREQFFARLTVTDVERLLALLRALLVLKPADAKLELGSVSLSSVEELEQKKTEVLTELKPGPHQL